MSTKRLFLFTWLFFLCMCFTTNAFAQQEPNDATDFTKKKNAALYEDSRFQWDNKLDFEFAKRGFIATQENLTIRDRHRNIIWSNEPYDKLVSKGEAPKTVNPSLWRHAIINSLHGLFKVTDGIYQIRGQELSNMTIIEGSTGYIIIDPCVSMEVAKNNFEFARSHLGKKPVKAVIYSHPHIDHFGGVRGIVSEEDVKAGKVKIIAQKDFMEYAICENVMAGPAMGRRSTYMYGNLLPVGPKGQVGAGEGKVTSAGLTTLITPTVIVGEKGKQMTVDGVEMLFQWAPGEAPVGMHVYFPRHKTIYVADNCVHSIHNVYTIRGALTRNATVWHKSIEKALEFKDAEFLMAGHNWPRFGELHVREYLKNQRDALKYMHDQTLRLLNQGYLGTEIAEMIDLPASLANKWYLRYYYGNFRHNVKGIYDYYMGWYDANPAHLNPLPPKETGKRMVEYMGGADAVIARAQKAYDGGEYRWVAQVLDYVVWAAPDNMKARNLAAAALEQLGYQTETAVWRNAYLSGAKELRMGVVKGVAPGIGNTEIPEVMDLTLLFDYMGISLNGPKAFGKHIAINWELTDTEQKYAMTLENGVLNYHEGALDNPDATLVLSRGALNELITGETPLDTLKKEGKIRVKGNKEKLRSLLGLLDKFDYWFPITTHR